MYVDINLIVPVGLNSRTANAGLEICYEIVVAKGFYANAYYAGDHPLDVALKKFLNHIEAAILPSLVTVCFSLASGTGSGSVVDLARQPSNVKLGAEFR